MKDRTRVAPSSSDTRFILLRVSSAFLFRLHLTCLNELVGIYEELAFV